MSTEHENELEIEVPVLVFDNDTIVDEGMKILKERFPDADVYNTYSNHNIGIKFKDGSHGICGVANGDLECDLFIDAEQYRKGEPYDNLLIARVEYKKSDEDSSENREDEVTTDKVPVGHTFPVPKDLVPAMEEGGYTFAWNASGLCVCGVTRVNLTISPIIPISIMPAIKPYIKENTKNLDDVYILEEDVVYFLVQFGDGAYIFNTLSTAMNFMGSIAQFKEHALIEGIKKKDND